MTLVSISISCFSTCPWEATGRANSLFWWIMPHVLVYFHLKCTCGYFSRLQLHQPICTYVLPTCTCMIPRWSCTQTKTYRKGRQKLTGCAWAWARAWAWKLKQTQSKNYYWLQCLQVSNMRNPLTGSLWSSFENSCFAQQPTETYQVYVDMREVMERFTCSINNIMYVWIIVHLDNN